MHIEDSLLVTWYKMFECWLINGPTAPWTNPVCVCVCVCECVCVWVCLCVCALVYTRTHVHTYTKLMMLSKRLIMYTKIKLI